MIVALTGGMGSGKSTVADYFSQCNVPVIRADEIVRELLTHNQTIIAAIKNHFGDHILNEGIIDRSQLRDIIFHHPKHKSWLEQLIHPLVHHAIEQAKLSLKPNSYLVVEIPLLIETQCQDQFDRILVVHCPTATRIQRVQQRDHTPITLINTMMKNQATVAEYQAHADDWLENTGDLISLQSKVHDLHQKYIELCKYP